MSKRINALTVQPGSRVRPGRASWHGIKFGAVCRVIEVYGDGDILVSGPTLNGFNKLNQVVDGTNCKVAK